MYFNKKNYIIYCIIIWDTISVSCNPANITDYSLLDSVPQYFSIKGTLKSNKDSTLLYLVKRGGSIGPDEQLTKLDSTLIINGNFSLSGCIFEPNYYSLVTDLSQGWLPFILENDNYIISGSLDSIWNAKISSFNTSTLAELETFSLMVSPLILEMNELSDSVDKYMDLKNEVMTSFYSDMKHRLDRRYSLTIAKFIKTFSNSYVSLFALYRLKRHISLEDRRDLFYRMGDRLKSHSFSKTLLLSLRDSAELVIKGNLLPNLSLKDYDGNEISLKSQVKRYLLIDFWASWCKPCREKYPRLKSFYHVYNDNFEIMSVSIDNNESNWIKALTVENLPWVHILDNHQTESWKLLFDITSIPTNILVDNKLEILGRNLSIEEIHRIIKIQ